MLTFHRHLLPICCTAAFILMAWMALSLPIAAVFLVDDAFVFSEYLKFVFYAAGIGLAVSAVIMFPLSLLLERLTTRSKLLTIAAPLLLLFVLAVSLLGIHFLTRQVSLSWTILLFAFSAAFGFYWIVLHFGNTLFSFVKRFLRRTPSS
jgi:hypothetical protein